MKIYTANSRNSAIQFENSTGGNENLWITNSDFQSIGSQTYTVSLRKHWNYVFIANNKIVQQNTSGYNSLAIYGSSKYVQVAGNYIYGDGHAPLALSPASYVTLIGNTVDAASVADEGGIEVEWKAGHSGTETSHHVTVIGNVVYNGNWCIYTHRRDTGDIAPHDVIIANNTVSGCTTGIYLNSGSNIMVTDNLLESNTTHLSIESGVTAEIKNNIGYVTENSGSATLSSGATSATVSHGLSTQPATSTISTVPTNNLGSASKFWISDVTPTTFKINVNTDPLGDANFVWHIGSY